MDNYSDISIQSLITKKKKAKPSFLKSFSIKNLNENLNVKINFGSDVKILIGENGLGKTTILNILYYLLSCRFSKLRTIIFTDLELVFVNGDSFKLDKKDLEIDEERARFSFPASLTRELNKLSQEDLDNIISYMDPDFSGDIVDKKLNVVKYSFINRYPRSMVFGALKYMYGSLGANNKVKIAKDLIRKNLSDMEVLYFPTYRRIEEDLLNLNITEKDPNVKSDDATLIQFGMKDIREKIDNVKKEINTKSSKGLSQISSEILSQLVKGEPELSDRTLRKISVNDIKIILARVGKAISIEDKEKIINIVESKNFRNSKDKYLLYFLQKLIDIYEQQRDIDNEISAFVSTCNHYLNMSDKDLYFDPSEVEFYILYKNSGKDNLQNRVLLNTILDKLSSGEKQILSLFSKIYLNQYENFLILFDEPELSLSIFWQRQLLPDIINSSRCKFLLAVTHSPFIFENEFQLNAIGLKEYIKYT